MHYNYIPVRLSGTERDNVNIYVPYDLPNFNEIIWRHKNQKPPTGGLSIKIGVPIDCVENEVEAEQVAEDWLQAHCSQPGYRVIDDKSDINGNIQLTPPEVERYKFNI